MGVARVNFAGKTLIDLTGDTVKPENLDIGVTAHDNSGNLIVGTKDGSGDLDAFVERSLTVLDCNAKSVGAYACRDNTTLEAVILDSVKTVNNNAFYGCTKLKTVSMGAAESLGNSAFYGCTALESVNIPAVKSLGSYVFYQCEGLAELYMPICESISSYTLRYCENLQTLDIGKAERLQSYALGGCTALKTLIIRRETVCTLSATSVLQGTPFASGGSGGTVYVPAALIESYQSATGWSTLYGYGTCNFVALEGSVYE